MEQFLQTTLDVLFVAVAIILILLSLMQSGKSEGASGAIMGGTSRGVFTNMKERGPELFLSRLTLWTGVAFFALALLVTLY